MATRDEQLFWDMCVSGALALQFHPRNHDLRNIALKELVLNAAHAADIALQERRKRWPSSQQ